MPIFLASIGYSRRVIAKVRDMPELQYDIDTEQEVDGRWIAEITNLPGVMAYGASRDEAIANAEAIALRLIADRIQASKSGTSRVSFGCA
jgi:predicted RNase H-like HicB family nuclease